MVLGFRTKWGKPPRPTEFERKILQDIKIHTLREDLKDRWKAGNMIHFVVGNRTKERREFKQAECTGTQRVYMTIDGKEFLLKIGDRLIGYVELEKFALNDGFDSVEEFKSWFRPLIEKAPHKLLSLKLIHWTDLRY